MWTIIREQFPAKMLALSNIYGLRLYRSGRNPIRPEPDIAAAAVDMAGADGTLQSVHL